MRTWRIRVKDNERETYLWGGLEFRQTLVSSLLLLIQVDEDGARTHITVVRDTVRYPMGHLSPEEQVAIPLNGIQAIYARAPEATYINCELIAAGAPPEPQFPGAYPGH